MKIILLTQGRTTDKHMGALAGGYVERLRHYLPFELVELPALRGAGSLTRDEQRQREWRQMSERLREGDYVVLLDERGRERRSVDFASWLGRLMAGGVRGRLVFLTGGPYGFAPEAYERAREQVSLSLMTFSHQMTRLIFVEQLYRALTILRGEPYHHE